MPASHRVHSMHSQSTHTTQGSRSFHLCMQMCVTLQVASRLHDKRDVIPRTVQEKKDIMTFLKPLSNGTRIMGIPRRMQFSFTI